MTKRSITFK